MTSSRRSFLHKAAVFAAATVVSNRGFAQSEEHEPTTNERFGLQTLASDPQETFEKWIGGAFRVSFGGKRYGTLVLASVVSANYPRSKAERELMGRSRPISMGVSVREVKATTLEFERMGAYLPQETFTLDHDWLGRFNLLLEPCLYSNGKITYVAIFTRFTGRMVPA